MSKSVNLIRNVSPARSASFAVLQAVSTGAYASDALREVSQNLSARDAGLATQIVFGCLRYQYQLDYLVVHYSGQDIQALDLPVQTALRMAIFQLRYLERVPPHAAVHESVELVKAHKRAATGFANAVLRKVNRAPVSWPDLSIELSCPSWLLHRWAAHFGQEAAINAARAALTESLSYIRIRPGDVPDPSLETEPTTVEGAFRLLPPPQPGMRLHDISSQAIVPLLDLQPGNTYLDLCAAPGNKTQQALEIPLGFAIACDISLRRLEEVPPVCERVQLDAGEPLPFNLKFDRIFVDAPCSGTGTTGRNPEIKWRLTEPDLTRFHEKQSAILRQAIRSLAPGGKVLYATCSLEREENEEVVAAALRQNPAFHCSREVWRIPGRDEGDGFYAAVLENE